MAKSRAPKRQTAQDSLPPALSDSQPRANQWLQRGVDDVYYQREAQVTWWTILGGIAVGALVTQVPGVISQIQAGRWFLLLYFLATALVIVNSWVQTTWGTLVLRWPISTSFTLLGFLTGLSECILSLQVTKPYAWMFAVSAMILSSMLTHLYFRRSGAWTALSPTHVARLKKQIWIYGVFCAGAFAGGLLLLRYPGQAHEILWGVITFSAAAFALWLQDEQMKFERMMFHIP